jgi:hypothetical protein
MPSGAGNGSSGWGVDAATGPPSVSTNTGEVMASSWLVGSGSRTSMPESGPAPRTSTRYQAGPVVTGTTKV